MKCENLEEVRESIDRIDGEIVKSFINFELSEYEELRQKEEV
ncbi:hypothetical protein [Clostridium saccharobutylicum]|uniref:Uncharacterized protein n=1 Tax=Clostridium saccharobutylicum DSM 13864 TaxID=1345695 RepID=U5MR98_CLOSA|nr:hypothetical protein [Clostridium saccharobutylicum]AGX43329.1 hypothetical protein CLSA_c23550 [Clostridium saccharobutylicum DSM 13864]AQR90628.1 hypothetical protein CLOSC_23490 [Clostridium saccharobutylicum]AQS00532.1 hypothetical protein CSACC_23560 [Clostridium saccharobutylicum]AQS10185.1 hypothetical protein CLOBY_23280 [Clostridium saccharobutylicum]AQS14515.1 hypothetical protein CLOSACC_23560 [Clostridium saccharobutylicum]